MPRENSFSDSDGRSLTPDLEDEIAAAHSPVSPTTQQRPPSVKRSAEHSRHHARLSLEKVEATLSAPAVYRPPSLRSPHDAQLQTPNQIRPTTTQFQTPIEKFRSTVKKVMAMRRTSFMMTRRGVGAEPGIDPRRESAFMNYGHIRQKCLIEVVDYSAVRSSFGRMTNTEFVRLISDERASAREPWVKVRWINVGGISWDVISALAIKYDIHPLALEDVLHNRGHARSKADYYTKHLFLRLLCHTLAGEDEASTGGTPPGSVTNLPRSNSPIPMDEDEEEEFGKGAEDDVYGADDEKTVYGNGNGSRFSTRRSGPLKNHVRRRLQTQDSDLEKHGAANARFSELPSIDKKSRKNVRNIHLIRELKRGERVNVKISPICIFLLRDGTVISIHRDTNLKFTEPITERLRQRDTGLRTTADPSLLVESLIDLVVDSALEIVEEYQSKILSLEQHVLIKPSMKSVRRLHIISGDLILHKRTLEPIKTVVYGLRRYDVDRVAALSEKLDPGVKVEGFMSHKAKIYLADVHDHMEYILTSLDMFAGISENLINFTFNMSSYEMNEVMRRLTLATIIFLPLTLLTGYFGMNFDNMWTVHHGHSDLIFWIIALPVMAIVIPIFMWNDLQRMAHYLAKRWQQRKVKKEVKSKYDKAKLA